MKLAAILVLACGCNSSAKLVDARPHDSIVVDDPPPIDAPPPTVFAVTPCPSNIAQLITATTNVPYQYQPTAASIHVNDVVQFQMPPIHNVVPNATNSDSGLEVNFGETKCLQFTKAGTFGFHCSPHGFAGSVNVN
jgi:plastocyanin